MTCQREAVRDGEVTDVEQNEGTSASVQGRVNEEWVEAGPRGSRG